MSNMAYCRFVNTYHDLLDCYNNWDGEIDDELSDAEIKYRDKLLGLCKKIAKFDEED